MVQPSEHESELELLSPLADTSRTQHDEAFSEAAHNRERHTSLDGSEPVYESPTPPVSHAPAKAQWPPSPGRLRSIAHEDAWANALDIVLACFPIAFFVVAGLAMHIREQEVSGYGQGVMQATQLGPSVFPIVFAAVVGGMMHHWALWMAQKGASLGALEQVSGSTSFAGTITTVFLLRRVWALTIPILLIWALSPIGGQGALRMVFEEPSVIPGNIDVEYANMTSGLTILDNIGSLVSNIHRANTIYTASLLAPADLKDSPRDLWGWPKIPLLHTLPQNVSSGDDNPWRIVPNNSVVSYSALAGNVIQGVPIDRKSEFTIETSYLDTRCHLLAFNLEADEAFDSMGGSLLMHNASDFWSLHGFVQSQWGSNFFIDTSYNYTNPSSPNSHVNLFYGTQNGQTSFGSYNATIFNCTFATVYVESWIDCQNATCAVTRMRRSETRKPADPNNPYAQMQETTVRNMIAELPNAAGPLQEFESTLTDGYIYGLPPGQDYDADRAWRNVSEEGMSARLTAVINTFLLATSNERAIRGVRRLEPGFNFSISSSNMTTATTSQSITVYRISYVWLTMFVIATAVLQVAAAVNLLLKFVTVAPDILGYVSSLTRDNPYISLPEGGSALSGLERSRLLRDYEVQLAGVDGHGNRPRIALVSKDIGNPDVQELCRGQRYI